jgi:hypothetical protein
MSTFSHTGTYVLRLFALRLVGFISTVALSRISFKTSPGLTAEAKKKKKK